MCKGKETNKNAEFFYNIVGENLADAGNVKQKVQFTISLTGCNSYCTYNVGLFFYLDNKKLNLKNIAETETQTSEGNEIKFNKFFVMEYYFEKEQPLGFAVSCNGNKHMIDVSLGRIMGSRGQVYVTDVPSGGKLVVYGKSIENNNLSGSFEVKLGDRFNKSLMFFIIKNLGTQSNPVNTKIYRSELRESPDIITFNSVKIPTQYLCNGDTQNTFIGIEIIDADQGSIGEHIGTFNQLITKPTTINLKNSGYNKTAEVKCKLTKEHSFLDFLRGGMQIALTIGIDFTGSNKNHQDPQSLHNINSNKMNSYEVAIKSCGDIVAYYDYDQLFPVFGYGAILPGYNQVNHCFPLNGTSNPDIHSINGILACYRNIVPTLNFYGPTFFAPIINTLINTVKGDLTQGKSMTYNILMILTDGQINDMEDTIDALVEASFLPISVIIIGIGMADFSNMDILDADDNPLYDRRNRKAARDLVQFVPFFKFQNDGQKLSEQVLEEIPRQVIEYYEQMNIIPGDPIVPLTGDGNNY